MSKGWIKLYRQILESPVFKHEGLLRLWMYCLLKARHEPGKVMIGLQEIELKPGQLVTGRYSLAADLGAKPEELEKIAMRYWRWLKKLEKLGNLFIKSFSKYSVITLSNWDFYQDKDKKCSHKECSSSVHQVFTNNNGNNVDNDLLSCHNSSSSTKEKKPSPIFPEESNEIKLSKRLLEHILQRNPGHKQPDIQTWAKYIDLMIRLDKRNLGEIERVIDWCQQDDFWQNNILSTKKLREKYDQLALKMKQPKRINSNQAGYAEPSKEFGKGGLVTPEERRRRLNAG